MFKKSTNSNKILTLQGRTDNSPIVDFTLWCKDVKQKPIKNLNELNDYSNEKTTKGAPAKFVSYSKHDQQI